MTPESIFQVSSNLAMSGWILLIFLSPFWSHTDKLIVGLVVVLLSLVYGWLIFQAFHPQDFQKFGSLSGVMELFTNKTALTAGWVHYLAFDLLTGTWIKRNGLKYGISHWLLIPCLLATFMLGPLGLLLYILIRTIRTKNYFAENS